MVQIVPRASIGVPDPVAAGRKRLPQVSSLLVHYTGVRGYPADPTRDWDYARSVANYGVVSGKRWEYSYLIGPGGTVYEQAGPYVAGHCLNWNSRSVGVLMMLGIGVEPTPEMIASFHELRAWLVEQGQLTTDHEVAPHYRYRWTSCAGLTLAERAGAVWASPTGQGWRGELLPALRQAAPPPPVSPPTTTPPAVDVPTPTLRRGSTGQEVRELQGQVSFWGWAALTLDGIFGPYTEAGVKRMQAALGVVVDGIYGPVTAGALRRFLVAMQGLA